MALCPTASAGSTSRGRSDRAGWFLPGPSVKVRRSYLLSAGGSAPSSFSAGFLTRPLIGASRPTAWSAPSIFRLPSCNPRTAAPLALTYKLTDPYRFAREASPTFREGGSHVRALQNCTTGFFAAECYGEGRVTP